MSGRAPRIRKELTVAFHANYRDMKAVVDRSVHERVRLPALSPWMWDFKHTVMRWHDPLRLRRPRT